MFFCWRGWHMKPSETDFNERTSQLCTKDPNINKVCQKLNILTFMKVGLLQDCISFISVYLINWQLYLHIGLIETCQTCIFKSKLVECKYHVQPTITRTNFLPHWCKYEYSDMRHKNNLSYGGIYTSFQLLVLLCWMLLVALIGAPLQCNAVQYNSCAII